MLSRISYLLLSPFVNPLLYLLTDQPAIRVHTLTMSSVESPVVLLKSQADWPRWIAVIQTKANHNNVWDYIKPTLEEGETRPELDKPSPPVVALFSATPNATLQSLNSDQLKRYEMAYRVYKDELKDWERRQTTINDIDDYIMRTTGTYWSCIEKVQGVLKRLQCLKDHVAPSNYVREQEVLTRYEAVRKSATATKTEEWLAQWESALSDLKERELPEYEGIRPTRAFLQAVEKIQPLFTQTWTNTIESTAVMFPSEDLATKVPDGFQIAQIFRNQLDLARDAMGVFAAVTLQGEEASADDHAQDAKGKMSRKCFEGNGRHTLDYCFYLRKDLRPDGWKMETAKAMRMLQGLKKSGDLQEQHKDAIKEMEDFLEEAEEEDSERPSSQPKSFVGQA